MDNDQTVLSKSPEETLEIGQRLGASLEGGEIILLRGNLGAGKTLLTKGIVGALEFDPDEVNSPSFTLVNLYKAADFDIYHIDLWRTEPRHDVAFAVGLDEILLDDTAIVIIEWADRLDRTDFGRIVYSIEIDGDGDDPRSIKISRKEHFSPVNV